MKKFIPMRSEQGSSLIEIIAAIMIISVLSLFFMKMFYQAEQVSSTSDRKLVASNLARQIAERYENVDFQTTLDKIKAETTKKLTVTKNSTDTALPKPLDTEINGTTFQTQVVLTLVDGDLSAYQDRMFKANVTVFWEDATNKRTSSSVDTYVTKEEIRR